MKSQKHVLMNDVISHCRHIDVHFGEVGVIKEFDRWGTPPPKQDVSAIKKQLTSLMLNAQSTLDKSWMMIKGMSSLIYAYLEKRGVRYGRHIAHPIYDTKVFSGRSRSSSFNVQGAEEGDPVYHPDREKNMFVCFDWVAADIRMAGLLSNDKFICDSFEDSDPYTMMSKLLSTDTEIVTRQDCKIQFLKGLYSMDPHSLFMEFTNGLRDWMQQKKNEYDNNYRYETMAGMPIPKDNIRKSFNAIIQGSVAEAIQSSLIMFAQKDIDCIVTERHDSLIIACSVDEIQSWVNYGVKVMNKPFAISNNNVKFPVKVCIGKEWGKWIAHKTVR